MAVTPVDAVAQGAAAAISKPVIGRKRTLTYTLEVERDGQVVDAQVVEERGFQVGALGAGLLAVGALAVGATAVAVAQDPEGAKAYLSKRKQAREQKKAESQALDQATAGNPISQIVTAPFRLLFGV